MSGVSTDQLAARAGLTYRQADHWRTRGVIVPDDDAHGSGSAVRWSEVEVAVATRLVEVARIFSVDRTISLNTLADIGHLLRTTHRGECDGIVVEPGCAPRLARRGLAAGAAHLWVGLL